MDKEFSIRNSQLAFRNYSCWIAGYSDARWNVFRDNRARADDRVVTDCHSAQDGGVAANAGLSSHDGWNYFPINVGLQRTAFSSRARIFVVDENHAVADEDFVLDRDAFADKAMRGNFAVAAYAGALLNLDERSNAGAVADLTAVEINEVMDFDVAAKLDVRRDYAELSRHETETKRRVSAG